jgi:hypothetical protein
MSCPQSGEALIIADKGSLFKVRQVAGAVFERGSTSKRPVENFAAGGEAWIERHGDSPSVVRRGGKVVGRVIRLDDRRAI